MGWTFTREPDRARFIDSITDKSAYASSYTPLERRVVSNHVWQLVRNDRTGEKTIVLHLIAKERKGGWGRKSISEDMGPFYYDCPLSLLSKASAPPCQTASEWRKQVVKYHEKKKRSAYKPGVLLRYGGRIYRLSEKAARTSRLAEHTP